MLAWAVTGGTQTPREMQLRATLATYRGKDSLIDAGTGSGKTLPIALNLLLDDPAQNGISLTISPLKRLQVTQENDFNVKYGILTISVNDETPREEDYWKQHVHDTATKTPGTARHIIVTVEQLFKSPEGHLPRMAILVRTPQFQKRIKRIHIDEAHSIHTAGLARNGIPAFRSAWGMLDELKALLPKSIPWQAMSATLPPHILKTVETKILRPNYVSIRISSNRPNTTYATHCLVSSLEKLENYECFLMKPFVFAAQPRVLIFFDDRKLTSLVSKYLDDQLPVNLRGRGIVRHYHSGMSEDYLQLAHNAFTDKDGNCKILCATSGESVGVDFPDVKIVCTVGVPGDIVDALQRGGRVGRRDGDHGLFIIFYEPWALTISLNEFVHGDIRDPDRPRASLKPTSTKQDRVAYSSLALVQCETCLRAFFADYLDDRTPNALTYLLHCCDRHAGFRLLDFLPSPLFIDTGTPNKRKPSAKRKSYRAVKERAELDQRLIAWLSTAHENDPLRGIRAMYDILPYSNRVNLVRAKASSLCTFQNITELFDETKEWEEEWAESLFTVVMDYERDLKSRGKGNSVVNSHVPKKTKVSR